MGFVSPLLVCDVSTTCWWWMYILSSSACWTLRLFALVDSGWAFAESASIWKYAWGPQPAHPIRKETSTMIMKCRGQIFNLVPQIIINCRKFSFLLKENKTLMNSVESEYQGKEEKGNVWHLYGFLVPLAHTNFKIIKSHPQGRQRVTQDKTKAL